MKLKVLIFLLISLINICSYAQYFESKTNYSIEWGEMVRFKGSVQGLFDVQSSSFSAIVDKPYWMKFFSGANKNIKIKDINNLKPTLHGKISFRGDGKRVRIEGLLDVGRELVAISSRKEGLFRKQEFLYTHEFNHFNINQEIDGKQFASFNRKIIYSADKQIGTNSSSNRKYGGLYITTPTTSEDYPAFEYLIYNEDKGLIKEEIIVFPYNIYEMEIKKQFISNNGDYYLIGEQYYKINHDKQWSERNREFAFMKIFKIEENQLVEIKIDEENTVITDIEIIQKENGNLLCTGFYAEEINGNIRGLIYIEVDPDKNEVIKRTKPSFSVDFFSSSTPSTIDKLFNKTHYSDKNKNNEFADFKFRSVKKMKDNSIVVIAEYNRIDLRTRGTAESGDVTQRYDHYYIFNDILVYKLDENGELVWVNRIPKKQQSINDGGIELSFAYFHTEQNVFFFFNDNKKNYDESDNFIDQEALKPASMNIINNTIAGVKVNLTNGESERSALMGKKELSTTFIPMLSQTDMNGGSLVLYGNEGRRHRFGRIRFN